MQAKFKLKDGRTITFREMTGDDILPGGNGRCLASCKMVLGGDPEPTENFRILNEAMIDKYGTTVILAVDQNNVAGFVNFFPTWCPHFDMCQDEQIDEAITHLDEIMHPPACADPTLHVRCLMIRPEYRGNRLSVHLLTHLKVWAKANGWSKIVGNGCIYSGKAAYQWVVSPKPPKPIWEKAGFCAGDYPPLQMKAVSDEESARTSFQWYKSDGFPKHLPRDIAVDTPDWREIFTDYTMVCEL